MSSPDRSVRSRHLAAAIALCAGAVVVGVTPQTSSTRALAAADDLTKVTLLGDSTMAGMEWYMYDDGDADAVANNDIREIVGGSYAMTFSAESCRRIVNTSCTGRFGTRPQSVLPVMQTALAGQLGQALVIMAGYDDASIASAVDQVMAEAEAQGVIEVLWLTYRTTTSYVLPGGEQASDLYRSHNAELAAAATRHPTLRVIDWNAYTADKQTWFASDGIHLDPEGAVGLARYIKANLDQQQPVIGRCRSSVALTGVVDSASTTAVAPAADRTGFIPMLPERVLDTRQPAPGVNGKLGQNRTVTIDLRGVLPDDATSAVLSVTAVDACLPGFLTVFPCGARPPTSNVNYELGRTTAGMAIASIADHKVCVFASAATDVAVDTIGAFAPGGQPFHPMSPTRFVDTRGGAALLAEVGEKHTTDDTDIAIRGEAGIPSSATAVWVNLTVADPDVATVLLAYPGPCGAAPLASTVNARARHDTASAALVGVGSDGSICVRTYSGQSHVVVDVAGWFGPGDGGLRYQPQAAARLLDTRAVSATPTVGEQKVAVGGTAVLNVTAADPTGFGFVTVRPCGASATSSLVNTTGGEDTANIIAVAPGAGGAVCAGSSVRSQLVVDEVGVFAP